MINIIKKIKILNIVIIVLLLISFVIIANAQIVERVSTVLPKVGELQSRLDSATGWTLRDDGQWVSEKNRLYVYDDFLDFSIREITINREKYILLIKRKKAIYYKYPKLKIEPYDGVTNEWWVFEKSQFNKIIDEKVPFNKSYAVNLIATYFGDSGNDTESSLIEFIPNRIQKQINELKKLIEEKDRYGTIKKGVVTFAIFPVTQKDKKFVRFLFLDKNNWIFYKDAIDENSFEYKEFIESLNTDYKSTLFNERYYEVEFDKFYSFIKH